MTSSQESAPQQVSLRDAFDNLASSDLAKFRQFFGQMRKAYPEEVAEACLLYIASHGLDSAGWTMAFWLVAENRYLNVLFDPKALPVDVAAKAATAMKEADSQFFANFIKTASELSTSEQIMRALAMLPLLGDYSAFLPWLRSLSHHQDERVRSNSAKLYCQLRPNKSLIDRQLQSDDARIRANAVEVLWHAQTPDATAVFASARKDPHHRVAANALVGLHFQKDPSAFDAMLGLASHQEPLFRAAIAWAFGHLLDPRAIPVLRQLSIDSSVLVRKRAQKSLLAVRAAEGRRDVAVAPASPVKAAESKPALPEPVLVPPPPKQNDAPRLFTFK